eukprot:1157179-Pelagomonas_calceolata.AAC.3
MGTNSTEGEQESRPQVEGGTCYATNAMTLNKSKRTRACASCRLRFSHRESLTVAARQASSAKKQGA